VDTPRTPDQHESNVPAPSAIRDVYVIARRRDDILLLLRSGTGYKDGEWGPPSGKVEPGETYTDAAVRELAEETGICVTPGDVRFLHAIERVPEFGNHWVGMFFEVDVASVNPANREPHKHNWLQFFPSSALPDRTVDYVRHVVDAVRRGEGHSEWRHLDAEGPLERRLTEP
jgi:8-oxo-dGTP diphosphatase